MPEFIVAGTGHRPDKLGGYGMLATERLNKFALRWLTDHPNATTVISGMAIGWDQALACAALIKQRKLICAIPFHGQEKLWPAMAQRKYRRILMEAEEVHYISDGKFPIRDMHLRNKWMVDRSTHMLALWNGSAGGTANCIRYANDVGRPVINLWDQWHAESVE